LSTNFLRTLDSSVIEAMAARRLLGCIFRPTT
jgi:hypothetical protein